MTKHYLSASFDTHAIVEAAGGQKGHMEKGTKQLQIRGTNHAPSRANSSRQTQAEVPHSRESPSPHFDSPLETVTNSGFSYTQSL
jgi:hypothetical protein